MCRLVGWRDYRWELVGGGEVSLSSREWTGSRAQVGVRPSSGEGGSRHGGEKG